MQVDPVTGSYLVAPSETITLNVHKTVAPYGVGYDLFNTSWQTIVQKDALTEERTFKAPSSVGTECAVGADYTFTPDQHGKYDPSDKYIVTFSGQTGQPDTRTVLPPNRSYRSYHFKVV